LGLSCACATPVKRRNAACSNFLMQDFRLNNQAAI
jgi:hypothetical protein